MQRFQHILNFPNCAGVIAHNEFTSRPNYSVNLCHHRNEFAPVKAEDMTHQIKDEKLVKMVLQPVLPLF